MSGQIRMSSAELRERSKIYGRKGKTLNKFYGN